MIKIFGESLEKNWSEYERMVIQRNNKKYIEVWYHNRSALDGLIIYHQDKYITQYEGIT